MFQQSKVHQAIDDAERNARKLSRSVADLKWIVFSDHHRGRRDGADDFMVCEQTYINALKYYADKGYTLLLLGDVEEFWENPLQIVMKRYSDILEREKEFHDDERLFRVWGNHDDVWRFTDVVNRYMKVFKEIKVSEAISLDVTHEGNFIVNILFIHGHQGNLESDRYAWISKFFVRFIWRNFQRLFKVPLSTPANNTALRSEHDNAMYGWAVNKDQQLIICGHTHQPVFMSMTHLDKLKMDIVALEKCMNDDPDECDQFTKELSEKRSKLQMLESKGSTLVSQKENFVPCYFNSGCCSFGDGDITGLEITDGMIKLVKWRPHDSDDPMVLGKSYLREISELTRNVK